MKNKWLFFLFFANLFLCTTNNAYTQTIIKKTEHQRYLKLQQQREESQNASKKKSVNFEVVKKIVKPKLATLDLSLRENNIFKSPIVRKYFSQEQLSQFGESKLNDIAYYFNKSYRIELLEGASNQYEINEFIKKLDPYLYESERKKGEEVEFEIPENGIRLVLEARNNLSYGIQNYLIKQSKGKCLTCDKSVRIPRGSPQNMKKVSY